MKERLPNRSRSLDDEITNWIWGRAQGYLALGHSWENSIKLMLTLCDTIPEADARLNIEAGRLMRREGVTKQEAIAILFSNFLNTYPELKQKERFNGELHGDD